MNDDLQRDRPLEWGAEDRKIQAPTYTGFSVASRVIGPPDAQPIECSAENRRIGKDRRPPVVQSDWHGT